MADSSNGGPDDRLTDQRRALPDAPGVYLFKDAGGRVLYVGKAKSIRKRVGSHFSGRSARGADEMLVAGRDDRLRRDRRTRPRRCSPSSASSSSTARRSTSGCGTTSPTRTSASRSTSSSRACTSRASGTAPERAYFGPFSSAKRVRETLDLLGQLFPYRTCDGPEPGRASGSPCLDYYIKRCQAPCVDYISEAGLPRQHRRDRPLPLRPLPADRARSRADDDGRRGGAGVRAGGGLPQPAAGGAVAVRAPAGGERHGRHARRARGGGRRHGRERAGVPGPGRRAGRPAELLSRESRGSHARPRSPRSSRSSTTRRRSRSRARSSGRPRSSRPTSCDRRWRSGARRRSSCATRKRGDKRRLYELAERNARLAHRAGQAAHPAAPPAAGRRAQRSARGARAWTRCRCGSRASTSRTSARPTRSRRWSSFEGGAPRKADYRRFKIRALEGRQDDFAAMQEVLEPAHGAVGRAARPLAARPVPRRELRRAAGRWS